MPNNQIEGGPSSKQRQNLEAERRRNAEIIIRVGRQVGASDRDILIGLMTAMQESSLRNLNYGDRDSLGLFQQRPSQGWGSPAQIMNPEYAAKKFFDALLRVPNRHKLPLTAAAQKVQRSAYPNAYAKHESYARNLLRTLGGSVDVGPALARDRKPGQQSPAEALRQDSRTPTSGSVAPSPAEGPDAFAGWERRENRSSQAGGAAAAMAPPMDFLSPIEQDPVLEIPEWEPPPGVADIAAAATSPLVATADKPIEVSNWTLTEMDREAYEAMRERAMSRSGTRLPKADQIIDFAKQFIGVPYRWGGESPLGFDCSGLVQYVYRQFGVNLPRVSFQQARAGAAVSHAEAAPGDLVWWDNSPRNNGADHIGIYLGNNQILEAFSTGYPVRIRKLKESDIRTAGFTRVL